MVGRWPDTGVANPDDEAIPGADCILRFMIDARYQGRGYGRAALLATLEHIKRQPNGRGIQLSYVPENEVAARLYAGAGFRPTGRIIDGEIEVWLDP
jgi:diamine N-acetyltransferase